MKESITPKKAELYLGTIKRQRPISKYWVEELSKKMSEGKWRYTGDPIRFDVDGHLIDGQHRLSACILSGVTIISEVQRNHEPDIFTHLDQARIRKSTDVLAMMGKKNRFALASTLKLLASYRNNETIMPTLLDLKLANEEVAKILKQYPRIESSINYILAVRIKGISVGIMTFCHYVFSQIDKPKADEFFHCLLTGENLSANNPILLLRNTLMQMKTVRDRKDRWKQLSLTFRVWQAVQNGETLTRLYIPQELPKI